MKIALLTTALVTGLAGTAYSGALDFVPAIEAEVVSPITDWSGAYAGVTGSSGTGSVTQTYNIETQSITPFSISAEPRGIPRPTTEEIDGAMYGAFAGFNIQRGAFVYGIEGAYSVGSVGYSYNDDDFTWGGEFTSFMDVKARAGIAAGNALIYGFAGATLSEFRTFGEGSDSGSPSGMNYGAGIDLLVTDRIFVGAEYIVRDLSGETVLRPYTIDANIQAVQARIGMNF